MMSAVTEFKTRAEFEAWLSEHASLVVDYAKANDVAIRDLPVSARTLNTLRLNGVEYVSQLVLAIPLRVAEDYLTGPIVKGLRLDFLQQHKQGMIQYVAERTAEKTTEADPLPSADGGQETAAAHTASGTGRFLLKDPDQKAAIIYALAAEQTPIESLAISDRALTFLQQSNIQYVYQALVMYPDGFARLQPVGVVLVVDEICRALEWAAEKRMKEIPVVQSDEAGCVDYAAWKAMRHKRGGASRFLLRDPVQKAAIIRQFAERKTPIEALELSTRTYNMLRRVNVELVYQAVALYPDVFLKLQNLGAKSVQELCYSLELAVEKLIYEMFVFAPETIKHEADCEAPTHESDCEEPTHEADSEELTGEGQEPSKDPAQKAAIIQMFAETKIPIDMLELSTRTYNVLRRANIVFIHQALELYPDGFAGLRNMGAKSVEEICRVLEWVMDNRKTLTSGNTIGADADKTQETLAEDMDVAAANYSLLELLEHPAFREKAMLALKLRDISVEAMDLSVRAVNALRRVNVFTFSDILPLYPDGIASLRNIGIKTVEEIKACVQFYLKELQPFVAAYCGDDTDAMYPDDYIRENVISNFDGVGFAGLSFQQMRAGLPEVISDERVKKCIGTLLAEKRLEYVDFRCYRVYPSVFDIVKESLLSEEDKDILLQRFSGKTLEEIASERGVTRERIRQIVNKKMAKLRTYAINAYGTDLFDEDFYTYLYEQYEVDKEVWFLYLGISEKTFAYLVNTYTKGKKELELALSDPGVSLILKFKIREYLNRNKILIDGVLMECKRSTIEEYALSKFARDELSFEEFADLYNGLLRDNGIAFTEKLYYTDDGRRTRTNRWPESRFCLWKNGERLRFYNIDAQDYTELLETLNIENLQNTEISTLKFFHDYPAVMEKYDIRDHYELHNLLKKVVDPGTCHAISFGRQPMIRFGEFDRDKVIYEIIEAFSPITMEDLAEYLHTEYGYDKGTVQSYFIPFMQYCHRSVFSVTFKRIPDDRVNLLKENLPEEFYYISEIKEVYTTLFPGADADEINHRSLKEMGYTVMNHYVLRGYATAESFFTHVLLRDDVFSLTPLNKRYGEIKMYWGAVYEVKKNLDVLLFDDGQYIAFRRLEKLGITKDDLRAYSEAVYDFVEDNTYFTIASLQDAVETNLDALGFGAPFYAGLLAASGKFEHVQCFGTPLLYKGCRSEQLSIKRFLLDELSAYDAVDVDDFIADCYDKYAIRIPERGEVTRALAGTDFYYDSIMEKIYRNKDYYYAEFDE